MNFAKIAAVAALTVAMAAPAFAQATPRSASTQHRLQQERMHRPARHHSAYRYEYRPRYDDNEDGVIADTFGGNPFGAPPYPWAYYYGGSGAFWITERSRPKQTQGVYEHTR